MYVEQKQFAMPSVRQLVASLSTQRYALRLVHVGFLLDKVAMLQIFPPKVWLSSGTIFPQCSILDSSITDAT